MVLPVSESRAALVASRSTLVSGIFPNYCKTSLISTIAFSVNNFLKILQTANIYEQPLQVAGGPPVGWADQIRRLEVRLAAADTGLANQRRIFEARARQESLEIMRLQQRVNDLVLLQGHAARPPAFPVVRTNYCINFFPTHVFYTISLFVMEFVYLATPVSSCSYGSSTDGDATSSLP